MPSEKVEERAPFQVLVIGGCYAGLAATLNLLDLCHGKQCRFDAYKAAAGGSPSEEEEAKRQRVPVQVTVVDERDGFCKWPYYYYLNSWSPRTVYLFVYLSSPRSSNWLPIGIRFVNIRRKSMDTVRRYPGAEDAGGAIRARQRRRSRLSYEDCQGQGK